MLLVAPVTDPSKSDLHRPSASSPTRQGGELPIPTGPLQHEDFDSTVEIEPGTEDEDGPNPLDHGSKEEEREVICRGTRQQGRHLIAANELDGGYDENFDDFDEDDFDDEFDDDFEEEVEGEYELQDNEFTGELDEFVESDSGFRGEVEEEEREEASPPPADSEEE